MAVVTGRGTTGFHDHTASCPARGGRRRRAVALAVLTGGVTLVGAGAFASWQSTTLATSAALGAATTAVALVDANGGSFSTAVANLAPGDYFYRYLDVQNNGSQGAPFTGTVSAPGALGAGLSVSADICSAAWSTAASTCPAGSASSAGSGPLSAAVSITHGTIPAGAVQHLRYRFQLSPAADPVLMGATTSVQVGVASDLVGGRDRTSS